MVRLLMYVTVTDKGVHAFVDCHSLSARPCCMFDVALGLDSGHAVCLVWLLGLTAVGD